ncbi:MAG: hypothetical protein ACMXYB_00540 [Candidatus Woesearchaeota archaeon]
MTLETYGNSKDCIDFALNQNGITIDKIIITRDEFIQKLANPHTIQTLLKGCSQLKTIEQFKKILNNPEVSEALKTPINPEFLRNLSRKFQEFFSSFDQVELKNYSFMNSMNSDTFNITIRTSQNCNFSVLNVDKNAIQSAFEEVFNKYFYSLSTKLNIKELDFQIEITKFEDVKKIFSLYKQGSKLLLFSQLGLPLEVEGSLYQIYAEQYSSYQNVLFYNSAKQEVIYCKQGSKLGYEQVQIKGKILEEQELISIHQITNSLNDVIVEGFINTKGKVQLTHIQVFTIPIEDSFEDKLLLYKSLNNNSSIQENEQISLVPFHEVDLSTPHNKYVIFRNSAEFKSALTSKVFEKVSGIIFTFSIFSHQLFSICSSLGISCIISKQELSKSQEAQINWSTLEIISQPNLENEDSEQNINPFSSILPRKTQETIDKANELNSIQDQLNIQAQKRSEEIQAQRDQLKQEQQNNFSQKYSTSNSEDIDKNSSNNSNSSLYGSINFASKKSALAMLADSVLNTSPKKEEQSSSSTPYSSPQLQREVYSVNQDMPQSMGHNVENNSINSVNSTTNLSPFEVSTNVDTVVNNSNNFSSSMFENNFYKNSENKILEYISKRLKQLEEEQKELQDLYQRYSNN